MKVTANGKTFEFPDGTGIDDIGTAIDEYFAGQSAQSGEAANNHDNNTLSSAQMANLDIPTDEIMAYHDKQKPQQSQQVQDPFTEAGKGLLQTGVNVANIAPEIADAFMSGASWAGNQLGLGDGTYKPSQRLELPDNLKPQDPYAKLGAEIGPYLIPGIGAERTAAALGSIVNAGRLERGATKLADMVAENAVGALAQNSQRDNGQRLATDLGVGVTGSGLARAAAPLLSRAYGAVSNKVNSVPGREAQKATEQVTSSSGSPVGVDTATNAAVNKQYGNVSDSFKHDKVLTDSARTLGIEPEQMFDAYLTKNKAGQEFQTQMALVPDSELSVVRKESLTALNNSAENLLDSLGRRNLSDMDDALVGRYHMTIKGLQDQEKRLYKSINRKISANSMVNANLTEELLTKWADKRGGWEYLSPMEKEVFEAVAPLGGG